MAATDLESIKARIKSHYESADFWQTPISQGIKDCEWLIEYLAALRSQRDALLAALRALSARCHRELADPEDVGDLQFADEVIAKAEGKELRGEPVK